MFLNKKLYIFLNKKYLDNEIQRILLLMYIDFF